MCCKVFKYEYKDGSFIYLNATDNASHELVLELYLKWYNYDFAPFEDLPKRFKNDFRFINSFCPIDFYDESAKIMRGIN